MNRPPSPAPRGPWQPRFTLGRLLLLMLIASVMAAAGSYLVQSLRQGGAFRLTFLLFTLAAPMLLAILVRLGLQLAGWINSGKQRSGANEEDSSGTDRPV